jgi:hypothetical protein
MPFIRHLILISIVFGSFAAHATLGPELGIEPPAPAAVTAVRHIKSVDSSSRLGLTPQMSIFNPSGLQIIHGGNQVTHFDTINSIPEFNLTLAVPITAIENWHFFAQARVGYFSKSGLLFGSNAQGRTSSQSLQLDSVPLSVSTRLEYQIDPSFLVRPALTLGIGDQRFHAAGTGFDEVNWVPFVFITPSLSFLDGETIRADWFGGFTFGVTYQAEIASPQKIRGLSFDLGLNFLL